MRYSANRDDPGYQRFVMARANGKDVVVYLDGVEQCKVVTADEGLGFIERCVLDADGNCQVDPTTRDRVWTETVRGNVRVGFRDAA